MARSIRVGKWLDCGCCGDDFQIWKGYTDQDQDDGYGICQQCQSEIQERNEAELDKIAQEIAAVMKPATRDAYLAKSVEDQRMFALQCVNKGLVKMSFSSN